MVGISGETMTSWIHSEFNWPLAVVKKPFLKDILKKAEKIARSFGLNFNFFISWAKLWQKLSMKFYTWVYLTVSSIWRYRIFGYLFWFLPLCLPAIDELLRTLNVNLGKKCTPYFTFHIFRYTHVYNFIHNFCQSVAQAIKKDWYDIPYFLKYCPTTLLWYLY